MAWGECKQFWDKHIESFTNGKETFSADWYDFINRMLQYSPEDRMTISEIKAHPWYNLALPTKEDVRFELKQRRELIDNIQSGERPGAVDKTIFSDPKR